MSYRRRTINDGPTSGSTCLLRRSTNVHSYWSYSTSLNHWINGLSVSGPMQCNIDILCSTQCSLCLTRASTSILLQTCSDSNTLRHNRLYDCQVIVYSPDTTCIRTRNDKNGAVEDRRVFNHGKMKVLRWTQGEKAKDRVGSTSSTRGKRRRWRSKRPPKASLNYSTTN